MIKKLVTVSVVNSGFSAAYAMTGAMGTAVAESHLADLFVTFAKATFNALQFGLGLYSEYCYPIFHF